MPCLGPTPEEELDMERSKNHELCGNYWTDSEWATNVACWFWNGGKGHPLSTELPRWVTLWGHRHDQQDAARKRLEQDAEREQHQRDKREFERLKRKLGKGADL